MNITPHHGKYFACDLTRRAANGMDRLSMALFDAAVDLNPHQIEAEFLSRMFSVGLTCDFSTFICGDG